jgi:hypothetical protein
MLDVFLFMGMFTPIMKPNRKTNAKTMIKTSNKILSLLPDTMPLLPRFCKLFSCLITLFCHARGLLRLQIKGFGIDG